MRPAGPAVCADSIYHVCCRQSLEAAVQAAAEVLNRAQRPAAIGGPMLKPYHGASADLLHSALVNLMHTSRMTH